MTKKALNVIFLIATFALGLTNSFSQSRHLFLVGKDNSMTDECCRVGFINEKGKLKINFKFHYAKDFSDGMSAVILTKGGKWGYADETGRIVIKPQFDEAISFSNGRAKVTKDGKTFYINRSGQRVFDSPPSLMLLSFANDLSPALSLETRKWGFVNRQGKTIIPFKFQNANPFHENLSAVSQNNLVGYIDKSGGWVIPPRFSPMIGHTDPLFLPNFSEGLAVYRDKDKYGFINSDGIIVIPASFDRAESFSEGLALVKLNEKAGYLKKDGQYAIEPKFESGGKFSNGLASIRIDGKWGYIDVAGRVQIQPEYGSAEPFRNCLARVSKYNEKDGSTTNGYINKSGKLIYSWKQ